MLFPSEALVKADINSDNMIKEEKQLTMVHGTDTAYVLAKKYKLKTAFGPLLDAAMGAGPGDIRQIE